MKIQNFEQYGHNRLNSKRGKFKSVRFSDYSTVTIETTMLFDQIFIAGNFLAPQGKMICTSFWISPNLLEWSYIGMTMATPLGSLNPIQNFYFTQ